MNVWHFSSLALTPNAVDASPIAFRLASFYSGLAGLQPGNILKAGTGAHEIKTYALTVGAPGAADDQSTLLATDTFIGGPYAAGSNPAMPAEVSVCLSMAASPASSPETISHPPAGQRGDEHPRSSRRGRVYLGPWVANEGSTEEVVGGKTMVGPTLRTVILNYAQALVDGLNTDRPGLKIAVYSRKLALVRPITEISVDNAFDTVRSRGPRKTLRETRIL